ncbi:MAG: BON domain-containing protein [Bacteroidia bacterium]|nr:BON domain-containing protein [Bacteroidia bacterium]
MKTDLEIQKDVMEELKWEPMLNVSEIGVAVKNGIVTLSGTVETYSKKLAAESAAKRVSGVKAVAMDIEVTIAKSGKRNDTEIAQAALNALKWNTQLSSEKIKVMVEDGWVTLEGTLEWEFQRIAARNALEYLIGVKGITNKITISPKTKIIDIKQKIKAAFQRSATIEADRINIETKGDKVILTGTVRSYSEKMDAEEAACAAPGIREVDNQLELESEVLTY